MTKTSLSVSIPIILLSVLLQVCATTKPSSTAASGPRYALIAAELISITPSAIRIKTARGEEVYIINEKTRYFDENEREIAPTNFATGEEIAIRADIDGKAPVDWVKKGTSVKIRFP